ncbi:ABC transporter permease [Zunongwangia sp. H14]|uniref:ABC transporter permease n=1 Tax=Zunongwangia sp. H14 TaxID=3240792 RepID=UPI0035687ABC
MFNFFFKQIIRNLWKHKSFTIINLSGLTIGLTVCLIIGLFVRDEMQFDKFIPDGNRIYRAYYHVTADEGMSTVASTPPIFSNILKDRFPEVEQTLKVLNISSKPLFENKEIKMYEEGGIFADTNFFEFFSLEFKFGTAKEALKDLSSIVISERMAQKYYGKKNPVGKEISIGKKLYRVSGEFKNNSKFHLQVNYVLPLSAAGIPKEQMQNWGWYGFHNYVKLKEGADLEALQTKFQEYSEPFLKDKGTTKFLPLFQPLHDIHLYSTNFKYDIAKRGDITYVNALIIIALFILIIACFNFVNLATAKSLQRAKEVAVRKTIGASRKHLLIQFLLETVCLTLISIFISCILVLALLPFINHFTGKQIQFDLIANPLNLFILLFFAVIVGIMAGSYPAMVLSSYTPVETLKGYHPRDSRSGKVPWLRHGIVIIQFSLTVLLIICALLVRKQVTYLHDKDLGFEKDQIIFFPIRGETMNNNYKTFKQELLQSPFVTEVSIGYGFPGDMVGDGFITVDGKPESKKVTQLMVDHDYIKTLGLHLVAGRDFSREMPTDSDHAFILNETAVLELGLGSPEEALGKTILWPTWRNPDTIKRGKIIGVVKDFNYKSLYEKVEPAVLQIYPDAYSKVAVKIKADNVEDALTQLKTVWNNFSPEYPLEYNFLDESFETMYQAEDKLKSLLWIFTAMAIFVGCLGLFGLAAYDTERRTKEIGIRKILGASVENIVLLLSKDFAKLIFIALIIASPIAWYFMKRWLQDFAYRINIGWAVFAIAGLLAITIALITVGFHAIKAACSNPINNIRTE